jgi:hypothetical protein
MFFIGQKITSALLHVEHKNPGSPSGGGGASIAMFESKERHVESAAR